jgi:F-type H+-transporting ATPase subunit delta
MASTNSALEFATAFLEAKQESWQTQLQELSRRLADGTALRTQVRVSRQDQAQVQAALREELPDETDPALINLATVLVLEDQLDLIPDIAAALQSQLTGATGPVKAQVTSAVALTEAQQEALQQKLAAEHGQDLDIQFLVDASIIGGLRIRVGDNLTDLSVSSSLQALREQVMASV